MTEEIYYKTTSKQIGFIMDIDTLNKLKQLKAHYKDSNQSTTLSRIVTQDYKRIFEKV